MSLINRLDNSIEENPF